MRFVVLFALAAFHWSPHCFMTLCAWASVVARARTPTMKRAESATLIEVLIIANPFDVGALSSSGGSLGSATIPELIPPRAAVPLNPA
jgi:hypothetical protein